jgi:predicted deacylase
MTTDDGSFTYNGGRVAPGETVHLRYAVSQTYLGDPVRIPVTIINGERDGPTVFLSAAVHGDELNGVAVVREVAHDYADEVVAGTVVCMPVLNVPGFTTQQRYLPVYDRDLNRAFPGDQGSTSSRRIAHQVWSNFIEPCDYGLDFHTSTRGRTNAFHVRADLSDEEAERLAHAFGSNILINSTGSDGMLRTEATEAGVPTLTIEMGEAHRFQRDLIDEAHAGIRSVFAELGIHDRGAVRHPPWQTTVEGWDEKTWLRADAGGIVEMQFDRGDLVHEGDVIGQITNPFKTDTDDIIAPFTGLLVGVLENPVVYPGNPLCHLVEVDDETRKIIESERTPVTTSPR